MPIELASSSLSCSCLYAAKAKIGHYQQVLVRGFKILVVLNIVPLFKRNSLDRREHVEAIAFDTEYQGDWMCVDCLDVR